MKHRILYHTVQTVWKQLLTHQKGKINIVAPLYTTIEQDEQLPSWNAGRKYLGSETAMIIFRGVNLLPDITQDRKLFRSSPSMISLYFSPQYDGLYC